MKSLQNLSYKTLFTILFFSLAGIVFFLKIGGKTTKVSAAWWDDMWHYRKAISITNTGTAITNQYVKITLDTSSLITADKMQSDCDDIRVTNINGKLLTHFIDGNSTYTCNTSTTSIYVLADSIPNSGSTIYVYYGNSSAANVEPQLGTQENPAISCKNILQHRSDNKGTQQYYITPTGNLTNSIQVTCDMTYSSGGWIKVWHGLPSEARWNDSTHETLNLSNNIIFNEMRVEGTNLNFNVIDTVTQTAMLGSTIRTYFNQVGSASDSSNPTVSFHTLAGVQSIKLTNNYFMYGYGNNWRFFYSCIDVADIDTLYIGGGSPACTPRSSFNSTSVNCYGDPPSNNYCPARTTTPLDSGLQLSLYEYQEASVYVRETAITLNNSQSMGTIQSEEAGGGPIAYWKFDEGSGTTTYDSSSNQNNGVISGATWQTEDMCISGKCLNFNGSNQFTNISNNPSLNTGNNITLSAWIYWRGGSGEQNIITKENAYEFRVNGGYINFAINPWDWSGGTSAPISQNKWVYVVITHDSDGQEKIYINGIEKFSRTSGGAIVANSEVVTIGARSGGSASFFNGLIDEPKIYSYVRTAAQIKQDYNSRGSASSKGSGVNMGTNKNNNSLSDGLVGYWKMDEGVGTSITDNSGNSKNGILTNVSWSSGKFGVGTSYNGSNSYIDISNFTTTSTVTLSAWVKSSNYESKIPLSLDGDSYSSGPNLYFTGGTINWNIGDGNSNQFVAGYPDSNWHHFVVVNDAVSNNAKLYIDGILKGTAAYRNSTITNGLFRIGDFHYGSYSVNGLIDEVRVYNRALSPTEISALYNYAPGPIGYWDFEEGSGSTIIDKSSNGKNLTTYNNPTWEQGKIGKSLNLNGSTQYAKITDSSFNRSNGQEISVSAWIYPKRLSGQYQDIVSNRTDGATFNWLLYQHTTDGSIQLHGANQNKSTYIPTLNQWTHIEATVDSSGNYKLYANGQLVQSLTGYQYWSATPNELHIGNYDSNSEPYQGKIDDVKIYNYARTQKQIIEDMNSGAPAASKKSMIAYYKFDEGSGTTANDSSINKTNATLYSNPTWSNNGKNNKALNFTASSDSRVRAPITSTNGLNIKGAITYSAWFKRNTTTGYQTIIDMLDSCTSDSDGYYLRFETGGILRFYSAIDDATGTDPFVLSYTNPILTDTSNWHQVIATWDGTTNSNGVKMYIDGKLVTQTTAGVDATLMASLAGQNLTIGSLMCNTHSFDGLIDEVKIYNYALTDDEVKQDYNSNSVLQFGQSSQTIGATTTSLEYCIPGDTSYCASPIAEYNFEENTGTTARDTSGNNNNGTISGATWSQGKKGAGLKFDGTNNYIDAGTGPSLNFGTNDFTVEFWINYKGPTAINSAYGSIIQKDNGPASNPGFTSGITTWGGSGSNYGILFSTTNDVWGTGNVEHAGAYSPNVWYHVTGVRSGTTFTIYQNGKYGVSRTTAGIGVNVNNSQSLKIGGSSWGYLNALIDGVKIYNYARTPAQVAYDYNKGGPVGWWKMDECQGSTVNDSSGVGNTGVIVIGSSGTQNSLGTCQTGTSATWTNGASGHINGSLNFDGTDDYVDIGTNFGTLSSYTISFWAKHNATNRMPFGSKGNTNFYWYGDNSWRYIHGGTAGEYYYSHKASIPTGTWGHFIATYDGSKVSIYRNGIFEGSQATSGSADFSSGFLIGSGYVDNSTYRFIGQIDDVRIYNYALTSEQIKQVYNGGAVSFN